MSDIERAQMDPTYRAAAIDELTRLYIQSLDDLFGEATRFVLTNNGDDARIHFTHRGGAHSFGAEFNIGSGPKRAHPSNPRWRPPTLEKYHGTVRITTGASDPAVVIMSIRPWRPAPPLPSATAAPPASTAGAIEETP